MFRKLILEIEKLTAIERVNGSLDSLGQLGNSSGMEPSARRLMVPLPGTSKEVPGFGPPVPARLDFGSEE